MIRSDCNPRGAAWSTPASCASAIARASASAHALVHALAVAIACASAPALASATAFAHAYASAIAPADVDAYASAIAHAIAPADVDAIAAAIATATADARAFVNADAAACANAIADVAGDQMKQSYNLKFAKGYIAHPYWPELERLINIDKESGTRRARSEANRAKALTEYLTKHGMTNEDYLRIRKLAERPFYTNAREIIIPENQIYGMLAQGADEARAATRVASRDQVRTTLTVLGPLHTGKTEADGVFERFAVVTAGTGAKLSNQRALRSNAYISDFSGMLELEFDDAHVDPRRVRDFLEFCGREIGIGASRKLGWGRFSIATP